MQQANLWYFDLNDIFANCKGICNNKIIKNIVYLNVVYAGITEIANVSKNNDLLIHINQQVWNQVKQNKHLKEIQIKYTSLL